MTQSASGLFQATGKTAKPKTVRLLDGSYTKVGSVARAEDDFTPTPPEPTLSLMHYEREALSRYPLIWEAACGDGRMMRDLESGGHKVVGSDLRDRGCGAAIKVDYMALLLNWSWPGAGGLGNLWQTHEPARAYLMRWKIDFTGEGAPPMLNGWFIWDRRASNKTCQLLMMDRKNARQGDLMEAVE